MASAVRRGRFMPPFRFIITAARLDALSDDELAALEAAYPVLQKLGLVGRPQGANRKTHTVRPKIEFIEPRGPRCQRPAAVAAGGSAAVHLIGSIEVCIGPLSEGRAGFCVGAIPRGG